MVNVLHLLWIIPISILTAVALLLLCLLITKRKDERNAYEQGVYDGQMMGENNVESTTTLGDLFHTRFWDDMDMFKTKTDGFMYGLNEYGQLYLIDINDDFDLDQRFIIGVFLAVSLEALRNDLIKLRLCEGLFCTPLIDFCCVSLIHSFFFHMQFSPS